ncbi:MAG: TIGR00730 family Rossman fold protein [Lachnospiraceae bacterium]|nr:TIGR00730 family Rossman fold protein [Lachnospiraceae bacterium]
MNITVYLGACAGTDPAFQKAVRELGTWIGNEKHTLIYGGSNCGLMGELADSVMAAGGRVIGVEPQFFVDEGFLHEGITGTIVVPDMSVRKAKMIALGDAFIAFPGGTGTLEEISEIMSKVSLGHLKAPCIVYNLNGYYDPLKTLLERMIEMGLSDRERQKLIFFEDSLEDIVPILNRVNSPFVGMLD